MDSKITYGFATLCGWISSVMVGTFWLKVIEDGASALVVGACGTVGGLIVKIIYDKWVKRSKKGIK